MSAEGTANFTVRQFSYLWKVSESREKTNTLPFFQKGKERDLGSSRLVSLTLIPGKVME